MQETNRQQKARMAMILRKVRSLVKYVGVFQNFWTAIGCRYWPGIYSDNVTVLFRDGRRMILRPRQDQVAFGEVFVAETYEPVSMLKNVSLVWDVGGNIGCFPLWASRFFPKAEFVSFEPCSETFDLLSINHRMNPQIRWRLENLGLSNVDEKCAGRMPEQESGMTSRYASAGALVQLILRDINAYWRESGCPCIDLLKIDCEGSEHDIIAAASPQLLNNVRFLIMETHPVAERRIEAMYTKLEAAGFTLSKNEKNENMCQGCRTRERTG